MENINTNQNTEQQPTTLTPEASGDQGGARTFTQEEVNRIISERLARERAKTGGDDDYKAKYEAVQKELEGMKAAQLHQKKEAAYRDLLAKANIHEKRIAAVMRASAAEIDALELDESGAAVGAERLVEAIKSEWADFVVTTEIRGANVPHPPVNYGGPDRLADAFKPKI